MTTIKATMTTIPKKQLLKITIPITKQQLDSREYTDDYTVYTAYTDYPKGKYKPYVYPEWPDLEKTKKNMKDKITSYLLEIEKEKDQYHKIHLLKQMLRYIEDNNVLYFMDSPKFKTALEDRLQIFYNQGQYWASSFYNSFFKYPLHHWSDKSIRELLIENLLSRFDVPVQEYHRELATRVLQKSDGDLEEAVQLIYDLFRSGEVKKFIILDR